jgi:hypothetical protein
MAPPLTATAVDNGTVLVAIMLVVAPIAAVAFARSGAAWKRIGKGSFAIEQELPAKTVAAPPPLDRAQQEAEARQMLEAKAYRMRQRGEAEIDVEAELRRVLAPAPDAAAVDAELRDEVRRLVVARNERRLRRGEPPLDVEAETERQLADFVGSS